MNLHFSNIDMGLTIFYAVVIFTALGGLLSNYFYDRHRHIKNQHG